MSGQPLPDPRQPCNHNLDVLKAELGGKFDVLAERLGTSDRKLEDIFQMTLSVKRTLSNGADKNNPSIATRLVLVEKWIGSQRVWNKIVGTAIVGAAINYIMWLCKP